MDYFGINEFQSKREAEQKIEKEKAVGKNLIDEEYFGESLIEDVSDRPTTTPKLGKMGNEFTPVMIDENHDRTELSEIDEQYFGSSGQIPSPVQMMDNVQHLKRSNKPYKTRVNNNDGNSLDNVVPVRHVIRQIRERTKMNLYTGHTLDCGTLDKDKMGSEQPDKHYRIPDDDDIKFHQLTEDEATNVLKESVIHLRDDLIVLSKPYGISSHPGPRHPYSITGLLPRLEHLIRTSSNRDAVHQSEPESYFAVHRLDRECTGVMLIARNLETSLRLQEAFARHLISKEYLCITVGIPHVTKADIRLPIVERNFNGIYKMCTVPLNRRSLEDIRRKQSKEIGAVTEKDEEQADLSESTTVHPNTPCTHFEVLSWRNEAALLKCSTLSGLKHQIRVHLAMGLDTPILGDHKYSHVSYLAPQRLPRRLLESLNVKQSKVRYMPLHLHASRLHYSPQLLKETSGENLKSTMLRSCDFRASPPAFFLANLKRIGLRLPK